MSLPQAKMIDKCGIYENKQSEKKKVLKNS